MLALRAWKMANSARWRIGDAINDAIRENGGKRMAVYESFADALGVSVRWVIEFAKVAEEFPAGKRNDNGLTWHDYRNVYTNLRKMRNQQAAGTYDYDIPFSDIGAEQGEGAGDE